MFNNYTLSSGRREGQPPRGGAPRGRKAGDPEQKAHRTPQGRRGTQKGGGGGGPPTAPTQQVNIRAIVGEPPSTEEDADLQGFTPTRVHLLLQEVYGYFPHQNDGTYLSVGVLDDATWQSCCRRLAEK